MKISETILKGCFLIEPNIFTDVRGSFFEVFRKTELEQKLGYEVNFVQENQSYSKKGVLRGLHFQIGKYAQAKLVNVPYGEVLDVIVDLRKNSGTFGQHIKIRLSDKNNKSIFIPKGMAHGFLVLSEEAVFNYKCDQYYNPKMESGLIYNDAYINIDWGFSEEHMIVSEKDKSLPTFKAMQI